MVSLFKKYSYKGTKKATNIFSTTIGQRRFGIVYKAKFKDGSMVAVKRMNKASKQDDDGFCQELLTRLHHRHLISLKGFCTKSHERFRNHTTFFSTFLCLCLAFNVR
ncbi:hypothetical protein FXO37_36069, partial [Capsicum annuum]